MKDMNFPIDMIWVGENMQVVYIKKNADPKYIPGNYGRNQTTGTQNMSGSYLWIFG